MNTAEQSTSQQTTGLHADNIDVAYRKGAAPVINGQSFDIERGCINVFIGPNGSGKSTVLKTLANQLIPQKGTVRIDGEKITQLTGKEFARRLGILFQENIAPNDLTVEELVYHGRYPHRSLFESMTDDDHQAVEQALSLSGADFLRHRLISQLSSGQKQLAWIAMLLAQKTDYILLDEPTTFLDLAHQFEIMDLVQKLNSDLGCTILMSVHDLNMAARYAHKIFVIKDGSLVCSGAPDVVINNDTISNVFGVTARIEKDPQTGCVYCVPVGRRDTPICDL